MLQGGDTSVSNRDYIKDEAENKSPFCGGLNPSTPAIWNTLLWCCWFSWRKKDLVRGERKTRIIGCSFNTELKWMWTKMTDWYGWQMNPSVSLQWDITSKVPPHWWFCGALLTTCLMSGGSKYIHFKASTAAIHKGTELVWVLRILFCTYTYMK